MLCKFFSLFFFKVDDPYSWAEHAKFRMEMGEINEHESRDTRNIPLRN